MTAWKDMKIRTKLSIGFGIVIFLLIATSAGSFFGLIRTTSLNEEVISNKDKTEMMLAREIDHLKWVQNLEDMFVNEKAQGVTVEKDHTQCALGRWLYGEEIEQFIGDDPELRRLIEAIKEPHQRLHESAHKIDETFVAFDLSLEALINEVWIKHLNWVIDLKQAMESGSEFTGELDPRKCLFGKWFYSYEAEDREFGDLIQKWKEPHEKLHQTADRINQELKNENIAGAKSIYESDLKPTLANLESIYNQTIEWIETSREKRLAAVQIFQSETIPALENVRHEFSKIRERAAIISEEVHQTMEQGLFIGYAVIIILALLAVGGGVFLAIRITNAISRPINNLTQQAELVANGDVTQQVDIDQEDEVGMLGQSMNRMVENLRNMANVADRIAKGDLTIDVPVRSEKDALGSALKEMVTQLNTVINQIRISSSEVASGSEELSSASQSMSQGATEQAASVEEISSSITQIESQMKLNADNGEQASSMAGETRHDAENGNQQMKVMISAMEKITNSSKDISKITKVIDEIAFQINLLSLNAAVEAARAGTHGKGFAVVADEVRNLATRSAQAASEISEMIEVSTHQVEEGTVIVGKTAEALQKIDNSVEKITDIISEIAVASKEQAAGIGQISEGLEQIDRVTQQNSAHSEESAASAQELSGQAMLLAELIDRFQLKDKNRVHYTGNDIQIDQVGFDKPLEIDSADNSPADLANKREIRKLENRPSANNRRSIIL